MIPDVVIEQTRDHLVDLRRDGMDVSDIRGFILAASESLLLVAVAGETVRMDGFSVLSRDDVTFLRWDTSRLNAWRGVLVRDAAEDARVAAAVCLDDWSAAFTSARAVAPLVSLLRERLDTSRCFVTRDFTLTDGWLIGEHITSEGARDGQFALRLHDLTRIDFGGEYEQGLGRMLG